MNNSGLWMTGMTLGFLFKALDALNNIVLWMIDYYSKSAI